MQWGTRVEPGRRQVSPRRDEERHRLGARSTSHVCQQAVFFRVAGACAPGVRVEHDACFVELAVDHCDREAVGVGQRRAGAACGEQVDNVGELAADGVGERRLPAGRRGVNVGAAVQQRRHRGGTAASGRDVQRRFRLLALSRSQVGPLCSSRRASSVSPSEP